MSHSLHPTGPEQPKRGPGSHRTPAQKETYFGWTPSAASAGPAMITPLPVTVSNPGAPRSIAEDTSAVRISAGVAVGLPDNSSAAIAAACGAAAEVPKNGWKPLTEVATPSAAVMSGLVRVAPPVEDTLPGVIAVPSAL